MLVDKVMTPVGRIPELHAGFRSKLLKKTSRPDALVLDDDFQAMKANYILPIVEDIRSGSLKRVLIIGDPRLDPRNAAAKDGEVSMMERFEAAGFPVVRLQVQYRMHPVISSIPSHKRRKQLAVTAPPAASPAPSHSPDPSPVAGPAPVSVAASAPAPGLAPRLTREQTVQAFRELEQRVDPETMKELCRRYLQ
jgi:hypothetical protein